MVRCVVERRRDAMKVKEIISEDFLNYKEPAMFVVSAVCDWKCCKEAGAQDVCQNKALAQQPNIDIDNETIYQKFITNDITRAVVVGGLEPMLQFDELNNLINRFRAHNCNCTFVIYTGYYESEIAEYISQLKQYKNIIIKFGRYVPDRPNKYDDVLGVDLASDNQYAVRL